jgi:hypothetical protein
MTSTNEMQLLKDHHWLRILLIGCTDKDLRQEYRLQQVEIELALASARTHSSVRVEVVT